MFKRILIPTDGSPASQRAILAGVGFASQNGAEVVGLTVIPPYDPVMIAADMLETTPEQYERAAGERARMILSDVEQAAQDAGVPCRLEQASGSSTWESIIETARRDGCDLILMASHGRKGIRGLLLGSQTQKVLVHSAIPVLVYR
ncbi:universal stress protein [Massilia sp. SYSU DXS3249]